MTSKKNNLENRQDIVIFDGHCQFCTGSIEKIKALDRFGKIKFLDYQLFQDVSLIDPRLTREMCHSQMYVLTYHGKLFGGFYAFRYLSTKLRFFWILAPLLYFPGMQWVGSAAYAFIASHRYLFHRRKSCKDNQCSR